MIRLVFAVLVLATQAIATPASYRLDAARSKVAFTYTLAGTAARGTMPIASADMTLDLADPAQSRVTVTLDAGGARTGFFLATRAMRGPRGLDTARHPHITFRSTRITGTLQAATVEGRLTVRGTTREVTLNATHYRRRGTDPAEPGRLSVLLTGEIDRHAFGVSGFPDLVGATIGLRIVARIGN